MPKKTFLNLSEEQKVKIIEISLKEFAEHDYDGASLNNIISSLEVTKGGFYRYFDSKIELYDFLIDYATDKKLNFIDCALETEETDFFRQLRNIIYLYLKFDLSFPLYGRFIFNVKYFNNTKSTASSIYRMEKVLKRIICKSIDSGALNCNYDADFIYHCIIKSAEGLEMYITDLMNNGQLENLQTIDEKGISHSKELEKIFDNFIGFLRNGLSSK